MIGLIITLVFIVLRDSRVDPDHHEGGLFALVDTPPAFLGPCSGYRGLATTFVGSLRSRGLRDIRYPGVVAEAEDLGGGSSSICSPISPCSWSSPSRIGRSCRRPDRGTHRGLAGRPWAAAALLRPRSGSGPAAGAMAVAPTATATPNVEGQAPGWYKSGTVGAGEQSYWDGSAWAARRRWSGGDWVEIPMAPVGPDGFDSSTPVPPAG